MPPRSKCSLGTQPAPEPDFAQAQNSSTLCCCCCFVSAFQYQIPKGKKKKHFPTGRMVSVTNIASEMKQGFYKPTSLCSTRPALLPLLSVLLCVGSAPLHSGEGSKRSLSCRQAAGFPACLITETAWSAQVLSYQIHLRLSVRVSQSWNLCPFKSYHLFHLRLCSPNLILTINQK